MRLGVVGCAASKLDQRAPARELYSPSRHFRAALAWALKFTDRVVIASALHGIVTLDTELDPYDFSFSKSQGQPVDRARHEAWGRRCADQLRARVGPGDEVVFTAGKDYWGVIAPHLRPVKWSAPFAHDALGVRTARMIREVGE